MKTLKLYFIFYKTSFLPPLALAIYALLKFNIMLLATVALTTATFLVWGYQRFISDKKKEKLYFYYNLGITELKLHLFVFFINLTILVGTNIYMK
ncbi:hypothetical protein [Tenacibaculum ovolyticum]|uniref:hypothetical protein n=1 Tax=Tenacibaculum ovolyticum TaxID=104270 RepID=UPI0012DF3EDD|nr:hypothetical protein [Tenacibaculum ovolyticum]